MWKMLIVGYGSTDLDYFLKDGWEPFAVTKGSFETSIYIRKFFKV